MNTPTTALKGERISYLGLSILCNLIQEIAQRGWCEATSGNFSLRSRGGFYVTRSGFDKKMCTPEDFLFITAEGVCAEGRPSDETALHTLIYANHPSADVVVHTHSVPATLLSHRLLLKGEKSIVISGFEMQKAVYGCGKEGHQASLCIPIFENSQSMTPLTQQLGIRWDEVIAHQAFLLAGHGLYTWGESLDQVRRNLMGLEFLFEVLLRR